MIWLTWRQYRMQFVVTAGLLAAFGCLLLVNGLGAAGAVDDAVALPKGSSERVALEMKARDLFGVVSDMLSYLVAVPVLIGAFWGAPLLSREFEHRTHHLVWTQSVSRGRWLGTRLGMLGGAVVAGGLASGLMLTWWLGSFDGINTTSPMDSSIMFPLSGVAPGGWWLFAFAAGTAVGVLLRRTLPAMAVTLAVVAVGLVLVGGLARDRYATPERGVLPSGTTNIQVPYGSDVVEMAWMAPDGTETSGSGAVLSARGASCSGGITTSSMACADKLGYKVVVYLQPESRYWRFQWTEVGLLLLASIALGAITVRRTIRTH